MKNMLCFVIAITVCAAVLFGCAGNPAGDETAGTYCRVECITEDGFVAGTEDGRFLFVKYAKAHRFDLFDTVVIEFSEEDLKPETGTVTMPDGDEAAYSHVLENPKSVRLAGPGEPTFA